CSPETKRRDTIPARALGSLSNTHAGPRHTPYKRATPRGEATIPMHRGRAAFRYGVPNLFGSENDRLVGSTYRSGRSRHWVKSKNPAAPAVKREAEEDWGR